MNSRQEYQRVLEKIQIERRTKHNDFKACNKENKSFKSEIIPKQKPKLKIFSNVFENKIIIK